MKSFLFLLPVLICLLANNSYAVDTNIIRHLQSISVTVEAGDTKGTGTIFIRKDSTGTNTVQLVWTAAHVIEGQREEQTYIDTNNVVKKRIIFKDVKVIKNIVKDGRVVGSRTVFAEVIKYSDADEAEDLAILRLRDNDFSESATFILDDVPPAVGTSIIHVGSMLGLPDSVSIGIVSSQGRLLYNKILFDQTTTTIFPGSSGGGVYLEDGRYIGMAARMAAPNVNFIIPARRIHEWAKKMNVEWALDPKVTMPSNEELAKQPIEPDAIVKDNNPLVQIITKTEKNIRGILSH